MVQDCTAALNQQQKEMEAANAMFKIGLPILSKLRDRTIQQDGLFRVCT
jgi:hypothetical protein